MNQPEGKSVSLDLKILSTASDINNEAVLVAHTADCLSIALIVLVDKQVQPHLVLKTVLAWIDEITNVKLVSPQLKIGVFPDIEQAMIVANHLFDHWDPKARQTPVTRFHKDAPINRPQFSTNQGPVTDVAEQANMAENIAKIVEAGVRVPVLVILQAAGLLGE